MKNYKKFLANLLFLILIFSLAYIFHEDIIAEIKDTFNIKPTQYYGINVDMSLISPESKNYVVNSSGEDLIDIASNLGINMFRITNNESGTNKKITPPYTHKQWAEVLNKMWRKGIYADILVESNGTDTNYFNPELGNYYLNFVKQYIVDSDLCRFSNVMIIDIRNEPILDQNNLKELKITSNIVKSSCPSKQLTIGSWKLNNNWHDPKGAFYLNNIVDIIAVHLYGFDKQKNNIYPDPYMFTERYLNEVRKYTKKPIIIEEFGAGNGTTLTDQKTLGSITLQKNTYSEVLKATYDESNKNVIGALGYIFLARTNIPDGWSISENNGNVLLPAAFTFKKYKN